jgi:membrane protein required for colicin V production
MLAASYAVPDGLKHLGWVDYTFLVIVVYSALTGAWVGFMAECITLAGIVAGTFIAGLTYHEAGKLLGYVGVPSNARDWAGFVGVFAIAYVVCSILSIKARRISNVMVQGLSNKLAGGLIGLLAGSIICLHLVVAAIYFHIGKVYDPVRHTQIVMNSKDLIQEFVTLLPVKMHIVNSYIP